MSNKSEITDEEVRKEYAESRAELDRQYLDESRESRDYHLVMRVAELENEIEKRRIGGINEQRIDKDG